MSLENCRDGMFQLEELVSDLQYKMNEGSLNLDKILDMKDLVKRQLNILNDMEEESQE